jgi:hypothetical protein
MKWTPFWLIALVGLHSSAASQDPIIPPITPGPDLGLLCSRVDKWQVRVAAIVVERTPGDGPGSKEEWGQRIMLWHNGPFAGGDFTVKNFEFKPPDNLDSGDPPHVVTDPSIGAFTFDNDRPKDRIVFDGKEFDPFNDDELPIVRVDFTNPCHVDVAQPLQQALKITLPVKCGSDHGRRACYTIALTPI